MDNCSVKERSCLSYRAIRLIYSLPTVSSRNYEVYFELAEHLAPSIKRQNSNSVSPLTSGRNNVLWLTCDYWSYTTLPALLSHYPKRGNNWASAHNEENKSSGDITVSKVSDEDNWQAVKNTLLRQVGIGGVPIISATDIDVKKGHQLRLLHEQGERELDPENTRHTMNHIYELWRRPIELETKVSGKTILYRVDEEGFSRKT